MATIKANAGIITQINVFTVPSGGQEPMIMHLRDAIECAHSVEGWLSASLHKSLDGTRVVNYAQCESILAWQTIFEKLKKEGFIEKNKQLGEAHPGLYEVVFSLEK